MSDIFLDFRPELNDMHLDNLERTLPVIKGNDYVTVIMEKDNAEQAGPIIQILSDNGFHIESKGALAADFAITAKRRLH